MDGWRRGRRRHKCVEHSRQRLFCCPAGGGANVGSGGRRYGARAPTCPYGRWSRYGAVHTPPARQSTVLQSCHRCTAPRGTAFPRAAVAGSFPRTPYDAGGSNVRPIGGSVVTVIVPHDLSWEPPPQPPPAPPVQPLPSTLTRSVGQLSVPATPADSAVPGAQSGSGAAAAATAAEDFVRDCATALLRVKAAAGRAALYLGGEALLAADGALLAAGQISAATGAVLLCEGAFARVDRGVGMPALRRLPYFPQEAASELARYSCLVLVDVKLPVANFGYK
jgi:hypothetical protein